MYSIGILDFTFDEHKNDKELFHIIELKNQRCEVFYEKLKFLYIELPKFKKKASELVTRFDKWLYVFTHLQDLHDRPQELQERIFKRLFRVAEIARFTARERKEYEESLKNYRDIKNVVDTARSEGKIEGKTEEKENAIERCPAEGISPEIISKIVNLPISEVKKMIEQIKRRKKSE